MKSRVSCILTAIFILAIEAMGPGLAKGADTGAKYAPDSEKLAAIDEISRNGSAWRTVRRWLIEYETTVLNAKSPYLPVHRIMAASAPGELYCFGSHASAQPWRIDAFSQDFFIHNGKTYQRWPFSRSYATGTITNGETISGSLPNDLLLTFVPNWPLTAYKMPSFGSGFEIMVPLALQASQYHLLAGHQYVNGAECAVFDNGVDRIWIAYEKGICVMRREIRTATGQLMQRISTDKVEQIKPRLWLPTELRSQLFSTKTSDSGAQTAEFGVHILRCEFNNDVPDSTFNPTFAPGTIEVNDANQFKQISPGGEDLLDNVVALLVKHMHLPLKAGLAGKYTSALLFFAGLAAGIGSFLFIIPFLKKPVPNHTNNRSLVN
jgi:hypothetical protein